MARALELARSAVGLASPNPAVGCVLVRNGEILGEGAHHYDTYDHAEIVALKQAAARELDVRGATAYVSLEPCSFHGRTGPCADALVLAGIARCVVATVDPHPRVSGAGIVKMRAAGIEVVVADSNSPIALQARRLNDAFAFSVRHDRPFVTLKAAVSLDGKLAPAPAQRAKREPVWLTGIAARADVQLLRHANDAIVTGIGTVLADDPLLTDRSGLPRRRPLLRVVLDSGLRMPGDSKMVASAAGDLLVAMTDRADVASEAKLMGQGIEVTRLDTNADGRIDLKALLHDLHRRQVRSVLLEAGSSMNGAFLNAGLVDRVVLYISETELGVDAVPFAAGQASPYVLQERLTSVTREAFRNGAMEDIRITGYLHDPWANSIESTDSSGSS
jgi:diaminohydroxyphosphoribosylaminopyrimidine deaminase/5-amino-6-(5-phosphoribosylamino)uracil reductase